jgi:hypothetical protein
MKTREVPVRMLALMLWPDQKLPAGEAPVNSRLD